MLVSMRCCRFSGAPPPGDFDLRVARQPCDFDRCADRRGFLEVLGVNAVHGREFVQVFHVDRARQDILEAQSLRFQARADVVEDLFGLFLDRYRLDGGAGFIQGDDPREIDQVAVPDHLRVGPDRRVNLVGRKHDLAAAGNGAAAQGQGSGKATGNAHSFVDVHAFSSSIGRALVACQNMCRNHLTTQCAPDWGIAEKACCESILPRLKRCQQARACRGHARKRNGPLGKRAARTSFRRGPDGVVSS